MPYDHNSWWLRLPQSKPERKFSYLTLLASHCSSYRLTKLPLEVVPAGDLFQRKFDEIFEDLKNVFGMVDEILIIGYDAYSSDHDRTLWQIM